MQKLFDKTFKLHGVPTPSTIYAARTLVSFYRVDTYIAYKALFVSTRHGNRPKTAKTLPCRQKNAIVGRLSVDTVKRIVR